MTRAILTMCELACTLTCTLAAASCERGPNAPHVGAAQVLAPGDPIGRGTMSNHQPVLSRGTMNVDPEQHEYARTSRERLRAIEARAQEIKLKRQAIPQEFQGDVAATLNLLPSQCDETERDIAALETISSSKWEQRKRQVDRKLAIMERSVDRMQTR